MQEALPHRRGHRLRWERVATMAAVLLIHLGLLAMLLTLPRWRGLALTASLSPSGALLVRMLPARIKPQPAMPPRPSPAHAIDVRRAMPVVRSIRATPMVAPPPQAPRAIDSLMVAAPAGYIAGGGRFSEPAYGRQNIRVPGSREPMRGMPIFRMADPRMQGMAGIIRLIGHVTGAVDPHCLTLDAEGGMSTRERIAQHVDTDDAPRAATAARYGCPDPLKPGAAMYYFKH